MSVTQPQALDRFAAAFGDRRGVESDRDRALLAGGPAAAARARELIALAESGALTEPLAALAAVSVPDPAAAEERAYAWPPKAVAQRAEGHERLNRWSSEPESFEDAELRLDPVDCVRRAIAQRVATDAVADWTPVLREFSHCIGLARFDLADHVIRIDDTLHLYEPSDTQLAGDRGYTQSMACKESAYEPAREGRLSTVPRGLWAEMSELERGQRPVELCRGCGANGWGPRYARARTETAENFCPLPDEPWNWVTQTTTARTYQLLLTKPGAGKFEVRACALAYCRERYLDSVSSPMQRDDKPCRWYKAAALTAEESSEVRHATYDARIFNQPVIDLLDAQCPASPDGFVATEAWRREWCDRLLEHLRTEHHR